MIARLIYPLLLSLLVAAPVLAADGQEAISYTNKFVGTLCPGLAEELVADGGRARKASGKQSFTSSDVSYCLLRASRSHFVDGSVLKGRASIAELRARTVSVVNGYFDRECAKASGTFVWGPSYEAKSGSQLQWRACATGNTYRFLFSVERATDEEWPVYFVHVAEPTDLVSAPSPRFSAYLEGRGIAAPGALTSQDWARVSIEEQRLIDSERAAVQSAEKENDRLRERQERRIANRDRKILVGARVCLEKQGLTYYGFTEQYSAQTDKIQIRVTGTSNRMMAYTPEILWDHVDNWTLCE